ncbi:hypothetical protein GCM10010377_80380 [Streptomyces viridiviolaceus]|nr:hypothetical protein GCM10010377_80380 [Streptomyces viridiviolaceus]
MGNGGSRVGGGDRLGQAELRLTQGVLDRGRLRVTVVTAAAGQDRGDLGAGQLPLGRGGGRLDQEFQGVCAGQFQVRVGGQGGGEVLAQRGPQLLEGAGAFPGQDLVGAGNDSDSLGLLAVPGHRSQLIVDTDQVGQLVRVALSLLAPDVPYRSLKQATCRGLIAWTW